MKTVTVEQFKSFRPCWLETAKGRKRFARISAIRNEWTALDVLNLPYVSAQDKLWSVLREEFIKAPILHEFACRCAEYSLSFVASPDPQSIAAIEAKRKWLRGEITDTELYAARDAAWYAAGDAVSRAARDAVIAATNRAERASAWYAAKAAAWYAAKAATWSDESNTTWDAASKHEVEILGQLLKE